MINSAAEYSELDAKMCQVRIADLENRLLEKQEAVKRLTAQMEELQQQLTQHSDSMQLQVCLIELGKGDNTTFILIRKIFRRQNSKFVLCVIEKYFSLLMCAAKTSTEVFHSPVSRTSCCLNQARVKLNLKCLYF